MTRPPQKIRYANMTANGRRAAGLLAVAIAFLLPKHVECGAPGVKCAAHAGAFRQTCTYYELEPLGFYVIELAVGRDVGFAYASGDDCH